MTKLVRCLASIALLASFSFGQAPAENLLETVEIHFSLPAEPSPESVGLDNPKSYWKVQYELMLSDSFELEKMGRCSRLPDYRLNCLLNYDRGLTKRMRKAALPIVKGEFIRRGPMSEADREVAIPVQLPPGAIDIFNRSVGKDGLNPTLLLFVKTKASTRARDKAKFKKKLVTEGIHPLKFYYADKRFADYWNIRRIGLSLGLSRDEDGAIRGFSVFRF